MSEQHGQGKFLRSTYSQGGNCVEFRVGSDGRVVVRHSKDRRRELIFTAAEWAAFTSGVKNDEFDEV